MIMVNEVSVKGEEKGSLSTRSYRREVNARGSFMKATELVITFRCIHSSMNSLFGFCLSLSNLYHPSSPVKSAIML